MKRSEYVKRAGTVTDYCGRLVGGKVGGERAARLAEEAGVQWDPEEPGLPERVRVEMGVFLRPEDSSHGLGHFSDEYLDALYLEAAARYNAVGSILTHDAGTMIHVDHIRRVLHKEREKLQ